MLACSFGRVLHLLTLHVRLPLPNGAVSSTRPGRACPGRAPADRRSRRVRSLYGVRARRTESHATASQRLVVDARPPATLMISVVAMRWMTPHVLAVLSSREDLVLLDAVTLQTIDAVPLRDAELVYQPHFASLAVAAKAPAAAPPLSAPPPSRPKPAAVAAATTATASHPPAVADRFINVFTQSLRVQRQAVLLLVCGACAVHRSGAPASAITLLTAVIALWRRAANRSLGTERPGSPRDHRVPAELVDKPHRGARPAARV